MSARHVVFTINNYTPETEEMIKIYFNDVANKCTYLVYGREVGESGTAHLQGYLQWSEPKKFAPLAKRWKGHFETARGSSTEAIAYCKKDKEIVEYGEARIIDRLAAQKRGGVARGKQVIDEWDLARVAATEGRFNDIPSQLYIQHEASFRRIYQHYQPKPADLEGEKLKNLWIWGPPRTGKSRLAREIATHPDFFYTKPLSKWWDHYQGEPIIIIDEVGPRDCRWLAEKLKIWMDRYAFIAEIKGSSRSIRPKHIIITANYNIHDTFKELNDDVLEEAIESRCMSVHVSAQFHPLNIKNLADKWRSWLEFDPSKEKRKEEPFRLPEPQEEEKLMDLDN